MKPTKRFTRRRNTSYKQQILNRAIREGIAPEVLQHLAQAIKIVWETVLPDELYETLLKYYHHKDAAGNTNLGADEMPSKSEVEEAKAHLLEKLPTFYVSTGLIRQVIPFGIRTGAVL